MGRALLVKRTRAMRRALMGSSARYRRVNRNRDPAGASSRNNSNAVLRRIFTTSPMRRDEPPVIMNSHAAIANSEKEERTILELEVQDQNLVWEDFADEFHCESTFGNQGAEVGFPSMLFMTPRRTRTPGNSTSLPYLKQCVRTIPRLTGGFTESGIQDKDIWPEHQGSPMTGMKKNERSHFVTQNE
ncbi:unnamed protein product [Trichogramma brassicae]|uniref:Uncharacterized protein n=1 Tax=Trichogramma brassicae TaxID=86971 RepID=A0A6H5J6W6_9HYME|nr:unnamed protein product [Trichogramma brassicae]